MSCCLALLLGLHAASAGWSERLSGPVVHPHSFAALSLNRYSVHSGFTDSLPHQVLANVLWAMTRVPALGSYRQLYVATRDNVYRYDAAENALVVHKPGDCRYSPGSAFEVGISCDRHEEAGMLTQAGLLAGTAFNDSAGPGVASCPMKWAADNANAEWDPARSILMVLVFGRADIKAPETSASIASSDTSLPRPQTAGPDSFEIVLMGLAQDSAFASLPLSPRTVSQLLWAGYGPTPHMTYNGRRGLTVPSAAAAYPLTGRIYLVQADGIYRYRNRPGSGRLTLADHRLEQVIAADRRDDLRQACSRVPSTAPLYFVVCAEDTASYASLQEAGCVAFQYLAQARALGLSGFVTAPLSRAERTEISRALSLPIDELPLLVFSAGEPAPVSLAERPVLVEIVRAKPAIRPDEVLQVRYLLHRSGPVEIEVFDLLGRPVRKLLEARETAGHHNIIWDGNDADGRRVKTGTYVISISSQGSVSRHRVAVF